MRWQNSHNALRHLWLCCQRKIPDKILLLFFVKSPLLKWVISRCWSIIEVENLGQLFIWGRLDNSLKIRFSRVIPSLFIQFYSYSSFYSYFLPMRLLCPLLNLSFPLFCSFFTIFFFFSLMNFCPTPRFIYFAHYLFTYLFTSIHIISCIHHFYLYYNSFIHFSVLLSFHLLPSMSFCFIKICWFSFLFRC